MERTAEIRELIASITAKPLEKHGELYGEINMKLSAQLQEIESA